MVNALFKYQDTLGGLDGFVPALTQFELAEFDFALGGFDFGDVSSGRSPGREFTKTALRQVWAAMPTAGRDELIDTVQDIMSNVAAVGGATADVLGAIVSGVSGAMGIIGPVIQASFALADAWVEVVAGKQEQNDIARRSARLKYLDSLDTLGPRAWAGGQWIGWRYERERASKANVFPLAWPPDYRSTNKKTVGPLIYEKGGAPQRSGDCSGGASDFSGGMTSSCTGFSMLFPMFWPVWTTPAIGAVGRSMQGMERTHDGGSAVWARMIAMQSSLLGNPITNLMCDGSKLLRRLKYFREFFWASYENPAFGQRSGFQYGGDGPGLQWLKWGGVYTDDYVKAIGGPRFKVGKRFDPDFPAGLKKGFFMTPAGLIATYDNLGNATIDSIDLARVSVYRWESVYTISTFGGNNITARDYNVIVAACNQFFALRMATLRRAPLMKELAKNWSAMFAKSYHPPQKTGDGFAGVPGSWHRDIPEQAVRDAIVAVAIGGPTNRPVEVTIKMPPPTATFVPLAQATFGGKPKGSFSVKGLKAKFGAQDLGPVDAVALGGTRPPWLLPVASVAGATAAGAFGWWLLRGRSGGRSKRAR